MGIFGAGNAGAAVTNLAAFDGANWEQNIDTLSPISD